MAEKTELEKVGFGKTLQCSCGNTGSIMIGTDGREVSDGFRRVDGKIVCQHCAAEQPNSN